MEDSAPTERSVIEQGEDRLRESRELLEELDELIDEPVEEGETAP